jgi:hypothetical protein
MSCDVALVPAAAGDPIRSAHTFLVQNNVLPTSKNVWCQSSAVKWVQHATVADTVFRFCDSDGTPSRALDIVLSDDWYVVAVYTWPIGGVDKSERKPLEEFFDAFQVQRLLFYFHES